MLFTSLSRILGASMLTALSLMSVTETFGQCTPTISSTGTILCGSNSITIVTSTAGGISNIQWYRNNVAIPGATIPTITVTQGGDYRVVAQRGSCASQSSPTLTIATGTNIAFPEGNPNVCQPGGSIHLQLQYTHSSYTYKWKRNGVFIAGANLETYKATQSGSYSVRVTTSSGCFVESLPILVNFFTINTTLTPAGPIALCPGATVTLNAVPVPDANYIWYKDNVNISGPNTTSPSWIVTEPGSYKVLINQLGCNQTSDPVVVNTGSAPIPILEGETDVPCVNKIETYTTNVGDFSDYDWSYTGATPVAGGDGEDYVTLRWDDAGPQTVSVSHVNNTNNCQSQVGTLNVTVGTTAGPAITGVVGLKINFVGEPFHLQVEHPEAAQSYEWTKPADVSIQHTGSGVQNSLVRVNTTDAGEKPFSIRAVSDGCFGPPFSDELNILSTALKRDDILMHHDELDAHSEGLIFLEKHSDNYNGCIDTYGPVRLNVQLDMGDSYNLGKHLFSATVQATVTAYYDLPELSQSWPVTFQINQLEPEQLLIKDLVVNPYQLKFIGIKIDDYTISDPNVAPQFIRLRGWYEEYDEVAADGITVQLNAVAVPENTDGNTFERIFSWTPSCADAPNYEFQLARTYDESVDPDWNEALTLYTEGSTRLAVTMAEGTDIYQWRVRAIGNKPGGITNPDNWSASSWATATFGYTLPVSEANRNWIYSRTFTEGNKVSEQLTYANELQQISQQQTRIQGIDQVVASQTIQDHVGRNAVTSLPIPVAGVSKLGYINGLLQSSGQTYNATHFDENIYAPHPATDLGGYYSGSDITINQGVPSAGGFPYTRTVFAKDGTGRVLEQSGVGYEHSLRDVGSRPARTVRTFYTDPAEGELVALFGREAPDVNSVEKITTFDANSTASISYRTKDGKVIATALAVAAQGGALAPLPGSNRRISDRITQKVQQGAHTIVSRKNLLFTEIKDVDINYSITPATLQEMCSGQSKTCQYMVEFRLYRDGVSLNYPGLPEQPMPIPPAGLNISFTLGGLQKETLYVLEKRITTTPLDPAEAEVVSEHFESALNTAIDAINNLVDAEGLEGLYAELDAQVSAGNYQYLAATRQYVIPAGNAGDCREFIYVPKLDLCPKETLNEETCLMSVGNPASDVGFEAYFERAYPAGSGITLRTGDNKLAYAFFTENRPVSQGGGNTQHHFAPGQLDAMFESMLIENSGENGRLTCKMMWDVWKQETDGYEAKQNASYTQPGLEEALPGFAERVPLQNDLVQSVLMALDGALQALAPEVQPDEVPDLCPADDDPYFIKRTHLYGKIEGGIQAFNLTDAYRYVFYDEDVPDMKNALKLYAGLTNPADEFTNPTLNHFNNIGGNYLDDCEKYQLSQQTRYGGSGTVDWETEKNKRISGVRVSCGRACDKREEEFRQAIIRKLVSNDAGVKIEHYSIHYNVATQTHIGVLDSTANTTGFDYSHCELDAMVAALVENCKSYCNTPLTVHDQPFPGDPNASVRVIGTEDEWAKIRKAMMYDFDVQVNQSCESGWDQMVADSQEYFNKVLAEGGFGSHSIKKDVDGNYYAIARLLGEAIALNTSSGVIYLTNEDNVPDFVITKFNSEGNLIWWRHFVVSTQTNSTMGMMSIMSATAQGIEGSSEVGFQMNVSSAGNVLFVFYTTFQQNVQVTLNSQLVISTSTPGRPTILGKIDSNGDLNWIDVDIDSDSFPTGVHFVTEDIHGNCYSLSNFSKVTKRTSLGQIVWRSDEVYLCCGGGRFMPSLRVDDAGNVYIQYVTQAATDNLSVFLNGGVIEVLNSNSAIVLTKLNSNGYYDWHHTYELNTPLPGREFMISPHNNSIFLAYSYEFVNNLTNPDELGIDYSTANFPNRIVYTQISSNKVPISNSVYDNVDPIEYFVPGAFLSYRNDYLVVQYEGNIVSFDKETKIFTNHGSTAYSTYTRDLLIQNDEIDYVIQFGKPFILNGPPVNGFSSLSQMWILIKEGDPCTHPSLCFKFTTEPNHGVTIPPSMTEDHTYQPEEETCVEASASSIRRSLAQQRDQIVNRRVKKFKDQYKNTCLTPSAINDNFVVSHPLGIHHFTLYYYDRAGNLIKTVPPKGSQNLLPVDGVAQLAASRNAPTAHTFITEYQYNSLGQLIREHSPDGTNASAGRPADNLTESAKNASDYYTTFIYNDKGQIRFSRNAKQKAEGKYSYTKYDDLGRIIEVGEASGYDEATLMTQRNNNSGYPVENTTSLTVTVYTDIVPAEHLPAGYTQDPYLRNRVSYTYTDEDGLTSTPEDRVYTIYNYDPHGNVNWLVQHIHGLPPVAMEYEYDLISGKVTKVSYNPGQPDEFYHRYGYDANNRITKVETSKDGYLWEQEATYDYYLHGPLRRTVIGDDKLQGMDYTYTIHGWLKAINHPLLDKTTDPSYGQTIRDGEAGSMVGRDAMGMSLTYYGGDYTRTGSPFETSHASTLLPATGKDLFNGNIAAWSLRNYYTGSTNANYASASLGYKTYQTGQQFRYDQLNRLLYSDFKYVNTSGNWTATADYYSEFAYDANGNIVKVINQGYGSNFQIDNATLEYPTTNNRLKRVSDQFSSPGFAQDVETQPVDNYTYDAIGNLIRDAQQDVDVVWNPYGKVLTVTRGDHHTEFGYDAAGNRVSKKRVNASGLATTNYYVRDASGNIMAVYEKIEQAGSEAETVLTELPIYGSDRLGNYINPVSLAGSTAVPLLPGEVRITSNTVKEQYENLSYLVDPGVQLTLAGGFTYTSSAATGNTFVVRVGEMGSGVPATEHLYTRRLNSRQYELKDHLGNIRNVISDVKLSVITGTTPGSYEPEVTSVMNYYPFGMEQPGRMWSASGKYRYGFNGKEKDDNGEWGSANYDYGFRIYNPSIGRFLSVDPLTPSYPMLTPYQFAGNSPIMFIDLDGLEPASPRYQWNSTNIKDYGYGKMFKVEGYWVFEQTDDQSNTIHQFYDPKIRGWKGFTPKVPENNVDDFAAVGLNALYLTGGGIAAGQGGIASWLLKETFEGVMEELTGIPIIPLNPDPSDILDPAINRNAKQLLKGSTNNLGKLFENQVIDKYRKKIIKQNEAIFDKTGRQFGEIDFETKESIFEVGLSLDGKLSQLHKLAEIAKDKGKKLTVIFDYTKTSKSRLSEFKESLRKKWGTRVEFVPEYLEQ